MPFQYVLANLLAQNEGAVGVLFLEKRGGLCGEPHVVAVHQHAHHGLLHVVVDVR